MTRRRPPKPSPSRDFRALAADRPQRALGLPVRTSEDTVPEADAHADIAPDDVELRLRTDADGARVTLVASVVYRRADELRRFAARVLDAADALEGSS